MSKFIRITVIVVDLEVERKNLRKVKDERMTRYRNYLSVKNIIKDKNKQLKRISTKNNNFVEGLHITIL